MPKSDLIEMNGVVVDSLGGGQYRIQVNDEEGHLTETTIRARLNGRMKKFRIRVMPGDKVKVAVSPYDLTHGMITFRGRA